MYTLDLHTGTVTRDIDGKQVACQSAEDADFVAYQVGEWRW
jgi:phage-related protein